MKYTIGMKMPKLAIDCNEIKAICGRMGEV
jgi:hypothetical protein